MKHKKLSIFYVILAGFILFNASTFIIIYSPSNSESFQNLNVSQASSFGIKTLWKYNNSYSLRQVAMSKDGSDIALLNGTSVVFFNKLSNSSLWSYDTGNNLNHVAISNDGEFVLIGDNSHMIYLFNKSITSPKQPVWTYDISNFARGLAISANGHYFAALSYNPNNTVYLFNNSDPSSPELLWTYDIGTYGLYSGLAISSNGEYVVAARTYGEVYLLNSSASASKTPLWTFDTNQDVGGIDICADGRYVVIGAGDEGANTGQIYLFNNSYSTIKQPEWNYSTHTEMLTAIISDDGNFVAASKASDSDQSINSTVYYLSTSDIKPKTSIWEYTHELNNPDFITVAMTSDGGYVAAGTGGMPSAYFFDNEQSASKEPLWHEKGNVIDIALSHNGTYMSILRYSDDGNELTFYELTLPSTSNDGVNAGSIPLGNYFFIFFLFGITLSIIIVKRKKSKL